MTPETKRDIVELLLRYSQAPSPIEISFLHEKELKPWQYPTPFDLHYSETWREQYQTDLAGGRWRQWNQKQNYDPDLAAHIILTNRRGICLWGEPIKAVFPSVPPKDYMASMLADIDWAKERVGQNPVYLILNLSRIYAYFRTGEIYSKDEGGVWVLNATPKAYHALVTAALEVYRGTGLDKSFDQKAVEQFVEYVEQEIKSLALR
jgi:streptomycin 3"-adenylyltransferase